MEEKCFKHNMCTYFRTSIAWLLLCSFIWCKIMWWITFKKVYRSEGKVLCINLSLITIALYSYYNINKQNNLVHHRKSHPHLNDTFISTTKTLSLQMNSITLTSTCWVDTKVSATQPTNTMFQVQNVLW